MGLNISVTKLVERTANENNSEKCIQWFEDQDWFDYTRHSGDRDFVVQYVFRYCDTLDADSGTYRPKDFDKAIEWVNSHIEFEGNKKRFIEALERMKLEENLYFTVSL